MTATRKPLKPGIYKTKIKKAKVKKNKSGIVSVDFETDGAMAMMGEPKKLSATDKKLAQAHYTGYREGRRDEAQVNQETINSYKRELERSKLDQVKAVTDLVKATTDNLSKCGYLIAKLNGGSGW